MLKQQPILINWKWRLESAPKQLWPYVTDINRLLKNIRQPAIRHTDILNSKKTGHTELSYDNIRRQEEWIEGPGQWEYPYRFEVTRNYASGPYHEISLRVDLIPRGSGTTLQMKIKTTPKSGFISFLATLKLKTVLKTRIKQTLRFYDELAGTETPVFKYNEPKRFARTVNNRLQEILNRLYDYPVDPSLFDNLVDYIQRADDIDLVRICPFTLSRHWNRPADEVLTFFIYAVKEDLLKFNWDLHCNRCRKIQASYPSLNQIHEPVYCNHCHEEFTVNFNRSVQLSFTPHPLIKKINRSPYSTQGPQTKPHVLVQQYLEPGQKRFLKTRLPEGRYALKSSNVPGQINLRIDKSGKDTVYVGVFDSGLHNEEVHITPEPNLTFENRSATSQIITIEKAEWSKNTLTAAKITSRQLFRDLFAEEVLRKGERIAVDNLTLMFTDLFDSTSMYNKEGDDKAAGRVIDHFEILQKVVAEENGAIVKTIGDSVMAVFFQPEQALRAYLNAHNLLFRDDRFDRRLKLKAGIHHGSCVAVNLNNRIDYFGSTVNIASRLADFATQNELIISDQAIPHVNLQKILRNFESDYLIENITTRLRGFDDSFSIKNIKLDRSGLRVAI